MSAVIGITPDAVRTSTEGAEFRLGTRMRVETSAGTKEYIYVEAAEAITAAGYLCVIKTTFDVEMVDTTATTPGTAGPGSMVGAAQAAIASGGFGWLQIYGVGSLRTLASCVKGTQLNSTGTPGAVDDDAGAGSEVINGLTLGTTTGGAEATNTDAFFNYPSIGRTL